MKVTFIFKYTKSYYFLILSYLFSCLFISCGIIFDPPREEFNKSKGDNILREEAVRSVKEALTSLALRCPDFVNSTFNYRGGYFLQIFPNTCKENYDPLKGCASENFIKKSELNLCILFLQTDPCVKNLSEPTKPETRLSSSFSITFAACAIAFRKPPVNLIF